MWGIAGFSGIDDRLLLEAMTDALIHRGPDDEGFYSDEQVSLGMRRLSIIDVQGGHALARPVVATSIDGVTEVAQHGVTALLVPPGKPAAVAESIISLLKDQELASRLGEAGRKLAEERFALSRTVEEVDQFYTTPLQKKGIR